MQVNDHSRVLDQLELPQPLAKVLTPDANASRQAHNWQRITQRIDGGAPGSRRMDWRLASVCLMATLVGTTALWFTQADPQNAMILAPVRPVGAAPVAQDVDPFVSSFEPAKGELRLVDGTEFKRLLVDDPLTSETRVTFEDASSITATAANTLVDALALTDRDVILRLAHGAIDVHVIKGGTRKWVIEAGELRVEVIGTRFSLSRSTTRVAVSVLEGVVLVRSPRLADGVERLTPGQHRELTIAASTSLEPGAEQLLQSADAARKAGNLPLAKQRLERLVSAFPTDALSGVAAFQRAVVMQQMGMPPGRLVGAFEAALRRARGHSLRQDCYWRLILALEASGNTEGARIQAQRALREYPDSRYAKEFQHRVRPVAPNPTSP